VGDEVTEESLGCKGGGQETLVEQDEWSAVIVQWGGRSGRRRWPSVGFVLDGAER
jgi:hypothetical protein